MALESLEQLFAPVSKNDTENLRKTMEGGVMHPLQNAQQLATLDTDPRTCPAPSPADSFDSPPAARPVLPLSSFPLSSLKVFR